jgi:predicted transcriptional regulator
MEDRLGDREAIRALRADLADLSERQRAALVLRELNGLGHKEIAQLLGCSPGAVKQAIFEARGALLKCREGREMACHDVQRTMSDGDRRHLRGRRLRSHLRSCADCRSFQADLTKRPRILRMLGTPLPSGSAAAQLQHLLAGQGGATGACTVAGAAAEAVTAKILVAVTVVATAMGGAGMAARSLRTPPAAPSPSPATAAQLAVGAPGFTSEPLRSTTTPRRQAGPPTTAGPLQRTRVGAALPEGSSRSADKPGADDRGSTATADTDGPRAAGHDVAPGSTESRAEQPVTETHVGQSGQSSQGRKRVPARDGLSRRPDDLPGSGRDRPSGAGDAQHNRGPGQPPSAGGGSAPAGAPRGSPPAAADQGAAGASGEAPAPPSGGRAPDASEGAQDGKGRADPTGDPRAGDGPPAPAAPPGSH